MNDFMPSSCCLEKTSLMDLEDGQDGCEQFVLKSGLED